MGDICFQTARLPPWYQLNMSVEVTTGVFDPRNYKDSDPNWARRRKSEYLSFPGKIRFTRTRSTEKGWWEKEEKEKKVDTEIMSKGLLADNAGSMEEPGQEPESINEKIERSRQDSIIGRRTSRTERSS